MRCNFLSIKTESNRNYCRRKPARTSKNTGAETIVIMVREIVTIKRRKTTFKHSALRITIYRTSNKTTKTIITLRQSIKKHRKSLYSHHRTALELLNNISRVSSRKTDKFQHLSDFVDLFEKNYHNLQLI